MTRSVRPSRRNLMTVAPLVALSLGLSACSGASSAESAQNKTITLAYQKFPSGDLIVKHDRLLEKTLPDYTIRWKAFDSGASVNTAFIAKSVDIGAIGSSPVARGLLAPLNIPYKVAFVLDVAGANEALIARNGSKISTITDLKGKRVATPFASTSHYSLLAALKHAGVSEQDVKIIDLQPQDILAAWKRGDIDAAYVWLPTLDELKKTGAVLVDSATVAEQGKPTLDLGVVSDDLIAQHPQVVDAWRKAEAQAVEQIRTDPDRASTAIGAELNIPPSEAKKQLSQGIYLSPAEIGSSQWLGTDGKPGGVASNLADAATFLADEKKIPAAPNATRLADAIYTKGLPNALTK